MAFVNEEPRKFNFTNEKELNNICPGYYLPITEYKPLRQNHVPFESSSLKLLASTNCNPGPGSYDIDKSSKNFTQRKMAEKILEIQKLDSFSHRHEHSNDNNSRVSEYNQANIKVKHNYEKLGFSIKEKRFKVNPEFISSETKSMVKIKENNKSNGNKKNRKPDNKIKGPLSAYINKIPSIPKRSSCGFIINEPNDYIQRDNPDKYIYFSGINGDTVGPGSYNLDIPEEWHCTGTNWSKMTAPRLNKVVKHTSNYFFDEPIVNNNINLHDYSNIDTLQQKSALNISKIALKHNLKIFPKRNRIISKSKNNNISHSGPGPGYYYNIKNHSSFQQLNQYEGPIIFGSKKERFNKSSLDHDYSSFSPGPATYFNKRKREMSSIISNRKKLKQKTKEPFNSNSSRFDATTKSSSSLPGPGTYDTQSSITNKNFSKTSTAFYAHQARFIETIQEIEYKKKIPGPGSYINPLPIMNRTVNSSESNDKFINSKRNKWQHCKRMNSSYRSIVLKKDIGPSVGDYNGDYSLSIEYNNIKKCINTTTEVAFNSSCPKKKNEIGQQNSIGPGSYLNNYYIDYHQRLVPFNYSTSRMLIMKKSKSTTNMIDHYNNDDENNNSSFLKKITYNVKYL